MKEIQMIDYDKLKIAHELCEKLSIIKNQYIQVKIQICLNDCSYALENNANIFKFEWFDSIEELITKLKELTEPQPKYKIGQEVWYITCEFEPISTKIEDLTWFEDSTHYLIDEGHIKESNLYPSKQALIEAQIEHWTKLKIDEISEDTIISTLCCGSTWSYYKSAKYVVNCAHCQKKFHEKCQHESDGILKDDSGTFELGCYKCKKCGQFYR